MIARQVSGVVNLINMGLPRRLDDNTNLERVSFDQVHTILVCHYTVERWDRDNGVAQKLSKHLFSMVDTIEYDYKTTDGRMQYAFVADKTTCN